MSTCITGRIDEGSSSLYEVDLTDEDDVAIPLADVDTLTATLYDEDTDTVLNARDAQDILNVNGGTFDALTGHLALQLVAADTAIIDSTKVRETHILLLELVLNNGNTRNWERRVIVTNLHRVP